MLSLKFLAPAIVASVAFAAPAFAEDIYYGLYNDSGLTLMEFYTSPSSSGDWGPDILGSDVVAPGGSADVTIADGSDQCAYDLLFVMEDGQQLTDSVDICAMASYTLQ